MVKTVRIGSRPGKSGHGDVSDFLARLWAQVDGLMADLENARLAPKEQAAVLATLARIAPQLIDADRKAKMPIDGRDPSELTNAQLRALVAEVASRE